MSDKKIDLIAQLLAKAESTTPEEAEALTEHAERLMIKYGIEQAVIDNRRAKAGQTTESVVMDKVLFTGAYRLEWAHLGNMVAMGLGSIKCLLGTHKNSSATLYLIGFESDIRQAKALIASLQVQAQVANRAWWKVNKAEYSILRSYDQEAARRSFVRGFANGAGQRIAASRQTAVKEAGTGTEIVLHDRNLRVQAVYAQMASGTARTLGKGKGSSFAAGQGYQAGQNANTGERAMTQGRGINA